MKRTFLLKLFVITISLALVYSCNKDKVNLITGTANKIEGYYELTSIQWDGDPIDINADGHASDDILSELMALPTNAQNSFQSAVLPINSDRSVGTIGFQFPMQNISRRWDGTMPVSDMIGNTLLLNISYKIEENGTLWVEHFESMNLSGHSSSVEMNKINNGTVKFDMKGELLFSVNYTLYDHCTKDLVTNTLHYTLRKL